ncbi:MAG: ATP-binding cassette domain-containing protein [Desulfobacteraceae bacterium]|nr:ATP-binding cassette domain-containing protein [Desulfobacteraceae bacterium]
MVEEKTKTSLLRQTNEAGFSIRARHLEPSVDLSGINFSFGEGESRKQVLYNNELKLFPGEIVIMTGPSGSGKTTLLTLIGALRSVQEGRMKVLGKELKGLSPVGLQQTRKNIGFIFQAHNLFESLTAFQTLALAMELFPCSKDEFASRPAEILRELGMEARMHYKPEKLSGGQRQRVAIGRALINHPGLILADEPTAALDKDTGRQVVELFRKRAREEHCTIIIVTHDNRIIDVADRVVNLVDGHIVSNVLVADTLAICNFLQKCPVFSTTDSSFLATAANQMRLETYGPGEVVIREGEEGDKFYLIRSGTAEVCKNIEGEDRLVAALSAGDFFGEVALLKNVKRTATVRAGEMLEVFSLPREEFDMLVRASSSFEEQLKKIYFNV